MAKYQSLALDCSKIFPLGLNYHVLPNKMDLSYFRRHVNVKNNSFGLFKELAYRALTRWARDPYKYFVPTENNMSHEPATNSEPKVLFMARTWDPYDDGKRSKEKIEMRCAINEMRAVCIRALKKEFGRRFFGGFSHTAYAKEKYSDLILPDEKTSSRGRYIARLREFPICVATTGLHGSIGWKTGEYVAFSKAIVSENLQYDVPGHLEAGKNYLEFINPDQCIENTVRLFDNTDLRLSMMNENREYYLDYLRPDRMILNTLNIAMNLAT